MIDTDPYQFTKELLTIIAAAKLRPPKEDDSDKRRVPRFPCVADLKVFQEETPDSLKQFHVNAKDISLKGVGIRCDIEIPVNDKVIIVLEYDGIPLASYARVVNCRQHEGRYQIGLVWDFD